MRIGPLILLVSVFMAISACGNASDPHDHDGHSTTDHAKSEHAHDDHAQDKDAHEAHETDAHDDEEHHDDHADHDDHDDAEGIDLSVHSHGAADLAVVLDGSALSLSLDSPLANFGVSEGAEEMDQVEAMYSAAPMPATAFTPSQAAGCIVESEDRSIIRSANHGRFEWQITYTCASPEKLKQIDVDLFRLSGFETIDTVLISGDEQTATTLTPKSHNLSWPK